MVKNRLESLGYGEKDIDLETFYPRFKALADKKGHHLRRMNMVALMEATTVEEWPTPNKLGYLNVTGKAGPLIPTATVRIACERPSPTQEAASGDGRGRPRHHQGPSTASWASPSPWRLFTWISSSAGQEARGPPLKIIAVAPEGTSPAVWQPAPTSSKRSALAYMDVVTRSTACAKFAPRLRSRRCTGPTVSL